MAYGQADEDELERALPGARLTHVLSVGSGQGVDVAIAILRAVQASGGRLEGLSVAQRGDFLDHQLRLGGLGPGAARTLSDALAALPGVRHATVEHRLGRA